MKKRPERGAFIKLVLVIYQASGLFLPTGWK